MNSLKALGFAALLVALAAIASDARAQAVLALEGTGSMPLSAPQSKLFGAGGAASVAGYYRALPWLLVGARLRGGLLANGDPPADPGRVNPGAGTFETLSAMLRLRPLAKASEPRSAVGLFVEAGGGGVLTGKLTRPGVEGGIGWGFPVGSFALAPVVRYVQVVQGSNALSSEDARLFLFGAELAVLDTHPAPPPAKPVEVVHESPDRDADGVPDADDACPDSPEDRDGFKDEDGCPDPDNDGDGIPDARDRCPNEAEDKDGFEDEDGCPDPDNDKDGFADKDDQCPNEAEVVNGNKDYDGCPDEGLIEFRNDRIVLEEEVLFDFERSRIKSGARPVLAAIMHLYGQHPEWMKIRIEGHADQRGKEEYNQKLSEERAQHVVGALVKLGIPADTIEAVGYGSTHPRDMRQEEKAYARNRRVEFVVLARREVAVQQPAATGVAPQEVGPAPQAAPVPAPALDARSAASRAAPAAPSPGGKP
ncbi:MAG: OmpA family protein [Polyangiales bacterium]